MTGRTIVLLVLALGLALGTALFARGWVDRQVAAVKPEVRIKTLTTEAVKVLVADEVIPAGTFVKPDNLRWQAWPEDGLSDAYAVEGKVRMSHFEGAVTRIALAEGQPVMDTQVVHPGDRGFLAAVLTPGMRAVSVPVTATSGISGFVFPGDKVDLLLTVKYQSKNEEGDNVRRYATRTLLNDVRVLAIDQKVEQADGEVEIAKTATVEVDPAQAERVALALEMGTIALSLRSLATEDANGTPMPESRRRYLLDAHLFGIMVGTKGSEVTVLRGSSEEKQKLF